MTDTFRNAFLNTALALPANHETDENIRFRRSSVDQIVALSLRALRHTKNYPIFVERTNYCVTREDVESILATAQALLSSPLARKRLSWLVNRSIHYAVCTRLLAYEQGLVIQRTGLPAMAALWSVDKAFLNAARDSYDELTALLDHLIGMDRRLQEFHLVFDADIGGYVERHMR